MTHPPSAATAAPMLALDGVHKRFGATVALRGASLRVRGGTVHALLGENGAGKSTLVNVAFGHVRPDAGTVLLDGRARAFASPAEAIAAGIGMVHQHYLLVPAMTVAENVALGRQGRYDLRAVAREIAAVGEATGLRVDPRARVAVLDVGAQQRVEIVKALVRGARVLVLDEPTAVLAPSEAAELLSWVRRFAQAGNAAVLITHKLREALAHADDVTVLRRGATVLSAAAGAVDEGTLVTAMLGGTGEDAAADAAGGAVGAVGAVGATGTMRHASAVAASGGAAGGDRGALHDAVGIEVGLGGPPRLQDASSTAGERHPSDTADITSPPTPAWTPARTPTRMSALTDDAGAPPRVQHAPAGAGEHHPNVAAPIAPSRAAAAHAPVLRLDDCSYHDERAVALVQHATLAVHAGEILGVAGIEGAGHHELLRLLAGRLRPTHGRATLPAAVGFVPEDRHRDALVLEMTLAENVALRDAGWRRGRIGWRAEAERTRALLEASAVQAPGPHAPAAALSGGNQQRLVLGRELLDDPPALVAESPTRGLDVRAAAAVLVRLRAARARGAAIVLHSSDLDELLALADRVVVVHAGRVREVPPTRDAVGRAMVGAA